MPGTLIMTRELLPVRRGFHTEVSGHSTRLRRARFPGVGGPPAWRSAGASYPPGVPLYALGDAEPDIHPTAYVHPDAVVIGNVTLGPESTVWPTAVLRGDDGRIEVGARSSIQDGSIIHTTLQQPTIIGDEVTVGHNVHIEAATIGNRALVSSGSVVLNGATVGEGAVVAAGAVVSPKADVPAYRMALGVPARVRDGYEVPADRWRYAVESYVDRGRRFASQLRRLEG